MNFVADRADLASQWHPTKNVPLTPESVTLGSNRIIWWTCSVLHPEYSWTAKPNLRKNALVTACPVCSNKVAIIGFNDLTTVKPELTKEWHPTKNGNLTPDGFTIRTAQTVWWQCEKSGHEWEADIGYRIREGLGCPVCVSLKVLQPDITKEWHPTKNGDLTPEHVRANSGVIVWWLGKTCGHEWEAEIRGRVRSKYGCPFCVNQRVLPGFNDLYTTDPLVASEWHPTKNGDLTPKQVTRGTKQKVWWLGKNCGHEWEASVRPRTSKDKVGCGVCRGLQVQVGVNDLETTHPSIAADWHPLKNGSLTVQDVVAGSSKKVWWLGKCGHEWDMIVGSRTERLKQGCPFCSNRRILIGYNDLASYNPKLASEWHPIKNENLTPKDVTRGSSNKVWWQCAECGHEWFSTIADRGGSKLSGCPQCSSRQIVSKNEMKLQEYIMGLGFTVENNIRNIIGKELDIFVPKKNIAIEYNGLYWHSEFFKTKTYHYDKWKACQDKGIQLIQVWEDDYIRNPELVKRMLAHKLGVATEPKVFARKTKVKLLTQSEATIFLDQNHIQGTVQGSIRLGLTVVDTHNTEPLERLVAVMVLKKEPGSEGKTLNLLRFATSQPVVGGFTKLLKQAEQSGDIEKIITFSDNTVSDGGLYESTSFIAEKTLAPDYMYLVKGERKHKFGYRLKKFREDPKLKYEEGLTERELALLNNIPRIWDAGKTRWVKQV